MNMVTYISRTEQEILSGESYNMSYIRKMIKVSFHYIHFLHSHLLQLRLFNMPCKYVRTSYTYFLPTHWFCFHCITSESI